MEGESSELKALLKMIRDLGGKATWPELVNNSSKYNIPLLDLKPLLEIAKRRGYIREEGEFYRLVYRERRLTMSSRG